MQHIELPILRSNLIRQEETIIFALIERAQFRLNPDVYRPGAIPLPDFDGCFSDYLLFETERIHARVRRYTSPDEHAFFADLPAPILPPLDDDVPIVANTINVNDRILTAYKEQVLPTICQPGDDRNYGSSATCDVAVLQALSKRIHYGKFIAEAKLRGEPDAYRQLAAAADRDGIRERLRDPDVEARLLRRVALKAAAYGQDIDGEATRPVYKIAPDVIAAIYRQWIIPLTIDVEIAYLLGRH